MMRLSDSTLPSSSARVKSSSEMRLRALASWALRSAASRFSAIWRAVRSSSVTRNVSPARGTARDPAPARDATGRPRATASPFSSCHRTDAAVGRSRDDRVADAQRSRLDEHGRDRTAALVELRLDRDTAGVLVRVRAQVETGVRGQQHGVEQVLDADVAAAPTRRRTSTSPPYSSATRPNSVSCWRTLAGLASGLSILFTATTIGTSGRLGVVQRLDRLRHDAVVGRDHEDRDVGHLRTTGTHGGERLVARGVDEGDGALDALVLGPDLVRTDVLRDAAGLARDDVRLADRVEQSGLTVVDVAHDGDDRRTDLEVLVVLVLELLVEVDVEALEELLVLVLGRDDLDLVAELVAEHLEGGLVERLGRRRHLTEVEQHGDERAGLHRVAGDVSILSAKSEIDAPRRMRMTVVAVAAGNAHAAERRGIPHLEFCALRPLRLARLGSCRRRGRRHRRCHRRGRDHDRRRHRDDRRSRRSRARRARRRDAGSRRRRRRDDRGRRDAAGTGRRDAAGAAGTTAGAGRTRARRDAGRRDAEPADAGCCRALGRWPMPCALANGLLPGRGLRRDAGPCPARSRRGCCRGAARRGAARGARMAPSRLGRGGRARRHAGAAGAAGARRCRRPPGRRPLPRPAPALGDRQRCVGAGAAGAAAGAGRGLRRGLGAGLRRGGGRRRLRARSAGAASPRCPSASSAAFSLRATGGSMVDEGLLTNSPISLSLARAILLSTPSSAAISCTRGLQPQFSCLGSTPDRGGPLVADGTHFEPLISCPLAVQPVLSMVCVSSVGRDTRSARPKARAPDGELDALVRRMHPRTPPGQRRPRHRPRRADSTATTLRSEDRGARARHPTHVLTGSILHLRAGSPPTSALRLSRLEDRVGLDVDLRAGQLRGEAGVLALLADRERELVVGHERAHGLASTRRGRSALVTFAGESAFATNVARSRT